MAWAAARPKILTPITSAREKSLFTCFLLKFVTKSFVPPNDLQALLVLHARDYGEQNAPAKKAFINSAGSQKAHSDLPTSFLNSCAESVSNA
jgi:hypothetical protein